MDDFHSTLRQDLAEQPTAMAFLRPEATTHQAKHSRRVRRRLKKLGHTKLEFVTLVERAWIHRVRRLAQGRTALDPSQRVPHIHVSDTGWWNEVDEVLTPEVDVVAGPRHGANVDQMCDVMSAKPRDKAVEAEIAITGGEDAHDPDLGPDFFLLADDSLGRKLRPGHFLLAALDCRHDLADDTFEL